MLKLGGFFTFSIPEMKRIARISWGIRELCRHRPAGQPGHHHFNYILTVMIVWLTKNNKRISKTEPIFEVIVPISIDFYIYWYLQYYYINLQYILRTGVDQVQYTLRAYGVDVCVSKLLIYSFQIYIKSLIRMNVIHIINAFFYYISLLNFESISPQFI